MVLRFSLRAGSTWGALKDKGWCRQWGWVATNEWVMHFHFHLRRRQYRAEELGIDLLRCTES